MKTRTLLLAILTALTLAAPAGATTPVLQTVGHDRLHATATFSAPGATDVTVYFATSPERATDGRFLTENSAGIDFLTDAEIASGVWMDADITSPGTYYVMLHAEQSGCYVNEGAVCMEGYSNVVMVTMPKPKPRFSVKFEPGFIASFTLTATPLGEDLPYKLCWKRTGRPRKCKRSIIHGSSWADGESDTIYLVASDLKLRASQKVVKFTWYVGKKRVRSGRVRITSGDY
jgi:hypothetical protein